MKMKTSRELFDHDRLRRFVNRVFEGAKRTEFPTVRRCARALRWSNARVIDACEGDPDADLMLTGYNFEEACAGDLYVETLDDEAGT